MSEAQTAKGVSRPTASPVHLIDRIREVIERHRIEDFAGATGHPCRCGATELSDHSRHVAEEVVAKLGLHPQRGSDLEDQIRYVSAWFDDVLTKLEGAE